MAHNLFHLYLQGPGARGEGGGRSRRDLSEEVSVRLSLIADYAGNCSPARARVFVSVHAASQPRNGHEPYGVFDWPQRERH